MLAKVDFSDAQSYYLARFLAEFQPDVPVSLIGYSLGARAATGALELLSGGSIADLACRRRSVARRRAPASRPAVPRRADGRGVRRRLAVARPSRRPALCAGRPHVGDDQRLRPRAEDYPRLYGRGGPEAMGYAGAVLLIRSRAACDKIEEIDVACSVGRRHDWDRYVAAPELIERLGWYTFLEPAAAD